MTDIEILHVPDLIQRLADSYRHRQEHNKKAVNEDFYQALLALTLPTTEQKIVDAVGGYPEKWPFVWWYEDDAPLCAHCEQIVSLVVDFISEPQYCGIRLCLSCLAEAMHKAQALLDVGTSS